MRGPTKEQMLHTSPQGLRKGSKLAKTLLDLRRKILTGEYSAHDLLLSKDLEEAYDANNQTIQIVLLRLALEGLVQVVPIKTRTRPNNAAINEFRVADLDVRNRMFSTRHGDFVSDISEHGHPDACKKTILATIGVADEEIAQLLNIKEGESVVYHRNLQLKNTDTVVCICDSYFPLWFAEKVPDLERANSDIYQLMIQLGKYPYWCTETIDMTQPSSVEREQLGLAPDDPMSLFKIRRISFDRSGEPLNVQFLTDRGNEYRLHYSFPLFKENIPEAFQEK